MSSLRDEIANRMRTHLECYHGDPDMLSAATYGEMIANDTLATVREALLSDAAVEAMIGVTKTGSLGLLGFGGLAVKQARRDIEQILDAAGITEDDDD